MSVKLTTMTIPGALLGKENPLPLFHPKERSTVVATNGTLTEEQMTLIGYETAKGCFPYKMQDNYSRERMPIELKVIVMENEFLKAVFLCEYGGRLYSLFDKTMGRDLLFKNPVFQPANLAIRDAWFSGGIEWNIGQVGHTFTTCEPLYCATLTDDNGEQFLRMYEYERCHGLFWHIDFHLPAGSKTLNLYARMVNDQEKSSPMYWWTNIAVVEQEKTRIFSDTDEVVYLDQKDKAFGRGDMPFLPILDQKDVSYPFNFSYSNEYFFQNAKDCIAPWEAAVYPDNWIFFERSSARLRYRKMFCWGVHKGGQRWKDFLSNPDEGNYIEIQGGMAPTQLHGLSMPPHSEWDFVQSFGGISADTKPCYEQWTSSKQQVKHYIDQQVSEMDIEQRHLALSCYKERVPEKILHLGSGFAALEQKMREIKKHTSIPAGFLFPQNAFKAEQAGFVTLLETGILPEIALNEPIPFVGGEDWKILLQQAIETEKGQNWYAYLQLGNLFMQQGEYEQAAGMFRQSNAVCKNILAYRNLAFLAQTAGNLPQAAQLYESGFAALEAKEIDSAYCCEYIKLLQQQQAHQKAWDYYCSLDLLQCTEHVQMAILKSAMELSKNDFIEEMFKKDFASIREGEIVLVDVWIEYHARQLAEQQNTVVTPALREQAQLQFPIPPTMDFRMFS